MSQVQLNTRDRLIDAARDLFLMQGYNATGIAQILKKAGVNSGSLYHFFPTKEDLLIAVLEWYRDHIGDGLLDPIYSRIDDPIERIFGLLDGYRQMLFVFEYDMGCPIGNLSLELTNSHPNARKLITLNFQNWVAAVEENLIQAGDRLPPNVDRKALAVHILAVMEGGVMLARSYRSMEPFDLAISQLRDTVDRLIKEATSWSGPGEDTGW